MRSFPFKIFGGKYPCCPGKESRIPKYQALGTLSSVLEIQVMDSDYIFGHPSPTTSAVAPS